jgi:nicotinamidase-related amidase
MINPSIKRIIEAFQFEIDAQKAADKVGLKGAKHMAEGFEDDLRSFLQGNGIEVCEVCGDYSDECSGTSDHDAECAQCRAYGDEMADTYKMLRQVR